MTNTIKATVPVHLYSPCFSPAGIREMVAKGDGRIAVLCMTFSAPKSPDYVQIGTAEIAVTLFSPSETAAAEVASLNAQLQEVRAQFHAKQSLILDRISKLQALGSSVEVE